jgi:hypothetical protein
MKPLAWTAVLVFVLWIGWSGGYANGVEEGRKNALKINPPSDEMELACAALWIGEQSKRWYERQGRKK